jgi:hypothetical protein
MSICINRRYVYKTAAEGVFTTNDGLTATVLMESKVMADANNTTHLPNPATIATICAEARQAAADTNAAARELLEFVRQERESRVGADKPNSVTNPAETRISSRTQR